MTDRDTFLRAIRADPDADTPRLVFADWLDDHGDPDWAELIRVQVELEPIHEELDHPRRQVLADRETELLARHGDRWLGPAKDLAADYPAYGPVFRRGLPESVSLSLDTFLARGGELFAACPTVREVCVYGVAGRGAELAECPHLRQVETLEVADWPDHDDARHLGGPGRLERVRTLRLWAGRPDDEVLHAGIVGGNSGLTVEVVELELRLNAVGVAISVYNRPHHNAPLPRWASRQLRPFADRFSVLGDLGHGLAAGHLADRTPVLLARARDGRVAVQRFAPDGTSKKYDLTDRTPVGFVPGLIRVREFLNRDRLGLSLWPECYRRDYLRGLLNRPAGVTDRWWADRGGVLKRWLHEGRFVIEWDGREFWLDASGTVVSS